MTTLSKGGVVFVGERSQLLFLEDGVDAKPQIIYGGEVLAFACNGDETVMALLLHSPQVSDSRIIRLYAFVENELGVVLCEVMNANANQLLWAGTRHLVACGPSGCTIYSLNDEKIKISVSDPATRSFLQAGRVALFYETSQTLKYWNLDTDRMMDSVKLMLNGRHLTCVAGSGYFGFALYDDGTVQAFYVTKNIIKKLRVFHKLFSMKKNDDMNAEASPTLLTCAISSRKVLIGLRGDKYVHKLEYRGEKVFMESMQEELPFPHLLVAFLRDGQRCLTRDAKTGKNHTLEISLGCGNLVFDNKGIKRTTTKSATDGVNAIPESSSSSVKGADNQFFVVTSNGAEGTTKYKNNFSPSLGVNNDDIKNSDSNVNNNRTSKKTRDQLVIQALNFTAVALVVIALLVRRII